MQYHFFIANDVIKSFCHTVFALVTILMINDVNFINVKQNSL